MNKKWKKAINKVVFEYPVERARRLCGETWSIHTSCLSILIQNDSALAVVDFYVPYWLFVFIHNSIYKQRARACNPKQMNEYGIHMRIYECVHTVWMCNSVLFSTRLIIFRTSMAAKAIDGSRNVDARGVQPNKEFEPSELIWVALSGIRHLLSFWCFPRKYGPTLAAFIWCSTLLQFATVLFTVNRAIQRSINWVDFKLANF